MSEYRYILEPFEGMKTRHICPSCNDKGKTFSKYIETENGSYIHNSVGRCNRILKCGYHLTPKQYFSENNISFDTTIKRPYTPPIEKPTSYIDAKVFKSSLNRYDVNHFVTFLNSKFGKEITQRAIELYRIGTSKHWTGSTVFWQIDIEGNIRTGKIMQYSPTTGKRTKEPYSLITWVHKALKLEVFNLKQCFFGEHLLNDKSKTIAIVESEKTAIIASIFLPKFIWLAVGSLTNLSPEKCEVLKGRNVVLYPDLNGFEKWKVKATELKHITDFAVSDLLEKKASEEERKQGLDLADYLLIFDLKTFIPSPMPEPKKEAIKEILQQTIYKEIDPTKYENPFTESEEKRAYNLKDLEALEAYFNSIELPQEIQLKQAERVCSPHLFIKSHIERCKSQLHTVSGLPFYNRLLELKTILEDNQTRTKAA